MFTGANLHDFDSRYHRFLISLQELRLDAFLITHPVHLNYLFNFKASAGMALCWEGETQLLVDSRYFEQAAGNAVNCRIVLIRDSHEEGLQEILQQTLREGSHSRRRIGLEARHLPYALGLRFTETDLPVDWVPTSEVVEKLRAVKEETELQILEEAFRIATESFRSVRANLSPGLTELEVAGWLEYEFRRRGAEGVAFPTIVASGPRSSLPHGSAGSRLLASREPVLIDFGLQYLGYCSDLTRVVLMPGAEEPPLCSIVREAQQAALEVIRPGVATTVVDAAARELIRRSGYGDYFGHSTGHGLGLEVHELPSISWRREALLEEGMVFTVEPGIYLPGRYGVRLEDVVVVTADGYRLLPAPC